MRGLPLLTIVIYPVDLRKLDESSFLEKPSEESSWDKKIIKNLIKWVLTWTIAQVNTGGFDVHLK